MQNNPLPLLFFYSTCGTLCKTTRQSQYLGLWLFLCVSTFLILLASVSCTLELGLKIYQVKSF